MTESKVVFPGEILSTSEELLSGDGTYEENGIIKADRVGEYKVDKKHRKATVKPITSVPTIIKRNDIVLVEVRSIKSSMVIGEIIHVVGKDRPLSGDTNSTLRVSEISKGYTKDPADEFNVGDIIRAKITQVRPSIQLQTKDRNFGVIKSFCSKCRGPLIRKNKILECKNCGEKEKRKIADDYGIYDILKL